MTVRRELVYPPIAPGTQPPYMHAAYTSTHKRAPQHDPVPLPAGLDETRGPEFRSGWAGAAVADLTRAHGGEALGQRIIIAGRILDEAGRPLRATLVEVWQANAAGRYVHPVDQHDAPLDPHFTGAGHLLTDDAGAFRFLTIKPGAYPWRNHTNAWRPAHVHFSVFGAGFGSRLVTQMYFPGDPLLPMDPIFHSVPDADARNRLIAGYDNDLSEPEYALGYRFDIIMRGRDATPMED